MSMITLETGELPICVDCQIKHAVDLKAHTEPGTERREKVAEIVEDIRRDLTMRKDQLKEFEEIREIEHKIEDYLTVLRDMRHDLQAQTEPEENPGNPIVRCPSCSTVMEKTPEIAHDLRTGRRMDVYKCPECGYEKLVLPYPSNPGNPGLEGCGFEKKVFQPKEHFDPASFRTLCPECPEGRCALCPPDLRCATRVIIGCPTGQFTEGRCQVGTQAHVIYHGASKPS